MAAALDHVREIAERVAGSGGLEVVEVEMHGGGNARILRIFIDRPGGVTHEDCASFSREVGTILDVEDAVPSGHYTLEVSSPGLDRRLYKAADYERFQGNLVKLSTFQPVNGNRHFEGRLTKFEGGKLTLDLDQVKSRKRAKEQGAGTLEFDLANVEKANLVPEL